MKQVCFLLFVLLPLALLAQESAPVVFNGSNISIGKDAMIAKSSKEITDVITAKKTLVFKKNNQDVINQGVSSATSWVQFSILNKSADNHLLLVISQTAIDIVNLYTTDEKGNTTVQKQGNAYAFNKRNYKNQNFVFNIDLPINQQRTFFLQVKSSTQLTLPIQIGYTHSILGFLSRQDMIFGLFFGLVCAMFFYNLFILFSVKDSIYLYYVFYILITTLSQCTLQGYAGKFLWPDSIWLSENGVFIFTNLGGTAAAIFTKKFLHSRQYAPLLNKLFNVVIALFAFSIILMLFNRKATSFIIMQTSTLIGSVIAILIAINVLRKGYAPAKFFLFAWFSLLAGATIFVLKDYNVLPVNTFTSNTIEFGFAIEVILLSFALADRINTYKKEKDLSQEQALRVSQENERLIQEQNVMLEKQVSERTRDLEKTLSELKDAQTQLVEAEKMASLGQLTAGIAHEINNPINFVKSNVSPLQMDVQDLFELITEYQKLHDLDANAQPEMLKKIRLLENKLDPDFLKEEIESLVSGIEEGAERTAEIVRGLRSFSRLDESESKEVSIYENINSTLILLRNHLPHYVKVRKHFEARPEIECYPGKLNQVFMNILANSVHAIKIKPVKNAEEYVDISVTEEGDYMRIRIADTGIGMTEEVKRKIFEPFFTTKDVGEGTGLGMAIVFKIIEKHNGKISVQSSPGEGAAFIIEIPYVLRSEPAITENLIPENEEADQQ